MTPLVQDLLRTAEHLLAGGERDPAATCLASALRLDPACLAAHNLIEIHRLACSLGEAFGINGEICEQDDIFRFFANHPSSLNPVRDYLSDGWRTLVELMRILEALDCKLSSCPSFLEFASGHGRFTRHLAQALPPGSLHVSDVVPGSVDFLCTRFGAQGFYSASVPERLAAPRRYQLILVLSLFSHLPLATWGRWLAVLYAALEPGGMLIFSTHGEKCARMAGVSLGGDGFAFFPASESQAIAGEEYGCTYTSAAYVRGALAALDGVGRVAEFPAHFWGNQDAYVLTRA